MSKKRITVLVVLLLIASYAVFVAFKWVRSTQQIKSICSTLTTDQTVLEVRQLVQKSTLLIMSGPIETKDGSTSLVHSPSSFGRAVCYITVQDDKVVHAKYSEAD